MSLGQRKEGKNPRRLSSPGPGVPLSSPHVSSASRSRHLSSSCHSSPHCSSSSCPHCSRLLVPVVLIFSSLSFSSSHPCRSHLLIPVVLVFSSPSFSPCRSSSPCPCHCCPLVVHPWSTLRAVAHSGGGGCWVAFVINSSSIYLKRFKNKNIKRE